MKMKFDFTQNREVENLEAVPSNFHAFYEKKEGDDAEGYALRADAVTTAAVASITGLNKSLTAARNDVESVKKSKTIDLSPLSEYGDSVEAIASNIKSKVEELASAKDHNSKSVAERIAQVKKEHGEALAAAVKERDERIASQEKSLHDFMLTSSIQSASAGWQGLNTTLISPFARAQMQVQEVDGKPKVVVVGDNGEARYSTMAERAGELMQADELLVEMSENKQYQQLFPSTQAQNGGGAQPKTTPVGARRHDATKNMTAAQKINHGLQNKSRR
jgi:uncharacterized alkaline shock family protein YloU